jgi:carbon monoxide dehydrogenase subunit G
MNASVGRLCLMILLLLPGPRVSAQSNATPVVSVEYEDPIFRVHASVVLPLTSCNAYNLLTDYGSLTSYIPGMLQVRHKRISPTRVDIWQEGEVEVLFFSVRLVSLLEMEETPNQRIAFRQTGGDMASYSGEWNLVQMREGTEVSYDATVTLKPEQLIPAFLARSVLEEEVRVRFEALATESSKRKNKVVPVCVSAQ